MRLSLKYKISLFFLLVLVAYTLSILLYYRFVIMKQATMDMRNFRDHFTASHTSLAQTAADLWSNPEELKPALHRLAQEKGMTIRLYDMTGEPVIMADYAKNGLWNFTSSDILRHDGKAVAFAEIRYPIQIRDVVSHFHSLGNFLRVSLLAMALCFLALVLYVHIQIVKPLLALHQSMKTARIGAIDFPAEGRSRDEISSLIRNFKEMGQRLKDSHQDQSDMVAAISHDLRTPLTSILGYVERLQKGKIQSVERQKEYYGVIHQKAKDMERLVHDFSAYSRSEESILLPDMEDTPVRAFLKSLCREYQLELEANHASLRYDIRIPEELTAAMDVKGIRRIIANLVDNAMSYGTPPVLVHIVAQWDGSHLDIAVEDNGSGVPEEELKRIFNRFYRVEKSRSRESGGSGLGLAICRSIAQAHGGSVHAYRSALGGLGVNIRLPLTPIM